MSITFAINKALDKKEAGGWNSWPKLYLAIDLHGTLIKPTYNKDSEIEFYPNVIYVLKHLTKKDNMCLILWTCKPDIKPVLEKFTEYSIEFDYINENPECSNDLLHNHDKKIYYDVLIDDKAGFEAENNGWEYFKIALSNRGYW